MQIISSQIWGAHLLKTLEDIKRKLEIIDMTVDNWKYN